MHRAHQNEPVLLLISLIRISNELVMLLLNLDHRIYIFFLMILEGKNIKEGRLPSRNLCRRRSRPSCDPCAAACLSQYIVAASCHCHSGVPTRAATSPSVGCCSLAVASAVLCGQEKNKGDDVATVRDLLQRCCCWEGS